MKEHRADFNLEMKIITPVHIGVGDKYTKLDFVFDPDKKQAGLLHEQNWFQWLNERGKLEQYTQDMQHQGFRLDNFKWLYQQGIRDPLNQCRETMVNIIDVDQDTSAMNDIVRQVKNVNQCPYIPGSSFKGSLRTAIMTALIHDAYQAGGQQAARLKSIWNDFSNLVLDPYNNAGRVNRESSRMIKQIEDVFFQPVLNGKGKEMAPMLADPFRGILVGDSQPFDKESTLLVKKHDLVMPAGKNPVSEISLWRESIKPGCSTQFQVSLNLNHLRAAGLDRIKDADSLIDCVSIFRQVVLDNHEKILIAKIKESSLASQYKLQPLYQVKGFQLMSLGGGIGLPTKSLIYSLAPDAEQASHVAESMLNKQFGKRKGRDTVASPRTIKTTYLKVKSGVETDGRHRLGIVAVRSV